jgi:hypothetical protein
VQTATAAAAAAVATALAAAPEPISFLRPRTQHVYLLSTRVRTRARTEYGPEYYVRTRVRSAQRSGHCYAILGYYHGTRVRTRVLELIDAFCQTPHEYVHVYSYECRLASRLSMTNERPDEPRRVQNSEFTRLFTLGVVKQSNQALGVCLGPTFLHYIAIALLAENITQKLEYSSTSSTKTYSDQANFVPFIVETGERINAAGLQFLSRILLYHGFVECPPVGLSRRRTM